MSYDYHMFVHPVPGGSIIPRDTQVRRVDSDRSKLETFFTTLGEFVAPKSHLKTYYLDYDITIPTEEER